MPLTLGSEQFAELVHLVPRFILPQHCAVNLLEVGAAVTVGLFFLGMPVSASMMSLSFDALPKFAPVTSIFSHSLLFHSFAGLCFLRLRDSGVGEGGLRGPLGSLALKSFFVLLRYRGFGV